MRRLLASVNWKAFTVLLVAGLLGVVAVLPYIMELVGTGIFSQAAGRTLQCRWHHPDKNAVMWLAGLQIHQP